jgi:hypothetical protein
MVDGDIIHIFEFGHQHNDVDGGADAGSNAVPSTRWIEISKAAITVLSSSINSTG